MTKSAFFSSSNNRKALYASETLKSLLRFTFFVTLNVNNNFSGSIMENNFFWRSTNDTKYFCAQSTLSRYSVRGPHSVFSMQFRKVLFRNANTIEKHSLQWKVLI